jgi:5'-methylthioadenosine phosphorylase
MLNSFKKIYSLRNPMQYTYEEVLATTKVDLAVIGGSGLYNMPCLQKKQEVRVETPYGDPSDAIIVGEIHGLSCAFLPRHGRGHLLSPSEINYRANIWALKRLGARFILSVSAVGSLQATIEPGHLVCPDQLIDRTLSRPRSFFTEGVAAHVPFGDPIDPTLRKILYTSAVAVSEVPIHDQGTYICIEGPSFSTRAESEWFRSMGASIVGMTNLPEARLAREAEMAYATLALSTDYDCWHADHDEVSVESVIAVVKQNVQQAQKVIERFCLDLPQHQEEHFIAHHALAQGAAIMSDWSRIPKATYQRIALLVDEYRL